MQTAYNISNDLYSPIGYYAAAIKDSDATDEISQFMDYMEGTQVQKILKKYGFGGAN
ncbi:substrate-binding domain-containing protein [Listeria cornellensis]|uniref:Molybdate ABC transporter substrate-binding protein n=1 Tax=Listeria cornellensis FSL F6-0969 TaxID=1265820 RepID=W7CG89_9LIST|nr:substrate-binding domain-containing protein [Listeria cornellensis]EUJ31898.1 molybdate ABC transporter substrate-binding protein [Listeria cornellensis FSL F6-0969]